MEIKKFEVRSKPNFDENGKQKVDENGNLKYFYQTRSNVGWITLYFRTQLLKNLTEEQRKVFQSKFFEIEVKDDDESWNITNKNGFDVVFISQFEKVVEKQFTSKKEKYFGK